MVSTVHFGTGVTRVSKRKFANLADANVALRPGRSDMTQPRDRQAGCGEIGPY